MMIAPSGRAGCRTCSEKIAKGSVRLGAATKWGGGANGYINKWAHVRCTRVPPEFYDEFDAREDVHAFGALSAAQQGEVVRTLKLKGTPKHLKTIDPNDPDFLKKSTLPEAPQPALVTIRALPYQREGFGWMCAQEESAHRGGILADEMGMGKTLQAISLVAATSAERALAAKLVRDHVSVQDTMNVPAAADVSAVISHASASESASPFASASTANKATPSTKTKAEGTAKATGKTRATTMTTSKATGKAKAPNKAKARARAKAKVAAKGGNGDAAEDDEDADFTPNSHSGARKAQRANSKKMRKAAATAAAAAASAHNHYVSPSDPGCPEGGPTLVVCPSSCVLQWFQEFQACTNMLAGRRSLKVLVVHSNRKKLRKRDLLTYDVILTTYPVLQYDYAQCVNAIKVPCQYCNKMFLERKLVLHNKYFCGPTARRTLKQRKTDRVQAAATGKAMVTLKIVDDEAVGAKHAARRGAAGAAQKKKKKKNIARKGVPTPSAIYKELMAETGRVPVPMYQSAGATPLSAAPAEAAAAAVSSSASPAAASPAAASPAAAAAAAVTSPSAVYPKKPSQKVLKETVKKALSAKKSPAASKRIGIPVAAALKKAAPSSDDVRRSGRKRKQVSYVEISDSDANGTSDGSDSDFHSSAEEESSSDSDFEVMSSQRIRLASRQKRSKPKGRASSSSSSSNSAKSSRSISSSSGAAKRPKKMTTHQMRALRRLGDTLSSGVSDPAPSPIFATSMPDVTFVVVEDDEEDVDISVMKSSTGNAGAKRKPRKAAQSSSSKKSTASSKKMKKKKKKTSASFLEKKIRKSPTARARRGGTSSRRSKNRSKSRSKSRSKKKVQSDSSDASSSSSPSSDSDSAPSSESDASSDSDDESNVDKDGTSLRDSILHRVRWTRVILDEAHKIKARTNNTAKSIYALRAKYRWCLTGTPLQNRIGELFSLVRFLRVHPYSYYFCKSKGCQCSWNVETHII